jgi:hypothetical protein
MTKSRGMKGKNTMNRIIIVLLFVVDYQSAFGQGALSPTAAPAPTMKSLSQIETRTPISALPATITASGSYYITTNLTCASCSNGVNGITISPNTADNVTIDLGGYTLFGVAGSGNGIDGGAGHNDVFRNGTLRNWGVDGVNAYSVKNSKFDGLQLYENANIGIEAGVGSVVSDCRAYDNTVAGFELALAGSISHCAATDNGTGIVASTGCVVVDCSASGNSSDGINVGVGTGVRGCTVYQNGNNGVTAANNCSVIGCTVSTNNYYGVAVGNNCTVKDCTVSANDNPGYATVGGINVGSNCTVIDCNASGNGFTGAGDGINCSSGNLITGNICNGNGNTGIIVSGGQNRIDGNAVGNNSGYGIYASSANVANRITRNSASGNSAANYYNYAGNTDYAPTGSVNNASVSPWANF